MSIFKKYRWLNILFSVFLMALGITIIILAIVKPTVIDMTITISTSVIFFVVGGIILINSFLYDSHRTFTSSLLYGSFAIALGIVVLILQFSGIAIVQELLLYMFSIFLITYGAASIIKAITLIIYRAKTSLIILLFIIGTLLVVAGILSMVFKSLFILVTYIVLGSALVAVGIFYMIKICSIK